jgi:hypothetical protein
MSRPKGSLNKRTRVALNALKTGELLGNGDSPVELMLRVMRDPEKPLELRLEAAKSVAPYIHPRLNSSEITNKTASYTEALDRIAALEAQRAVKPQDPAIH